jgi:signal transduction histidine kinase
MPTGELLDRIRTAWIQRVSNRLAQESGVRENFSAELGKFFLLWKEAIDGNDPGCLDRLIQDWSDSLTEPDIGSQTSSLIPILDAIFQNTIAAAREQLSPGEAIQVLSDFTPIYTHAIEQVTNIELQRNIRKIALEVEKANLALEKLDRSKSDFIAVAAHELKTPLTLIEGYASMLKETLASNKSVSPIELYLKGIDSGSRRLREIVNDMIDVSLIDNNLLSLNWQPVWVNRILEVVDYEARKLMKDRILELLVNTIPGSEVMTYGDGERLLQAFRNLVANAVKYTPDGGKITIDGRSLPGFIEITISDTGIGIDPENHGLIFEKFGGLGDVALHSSSKTRFKGGGPGLGLPITKGIIEAHGGAIWVESEGYDEIRLPGSTFHVLLPIRKDCPDDKTAKLFHPLEEIVQRPV